MTEDVRKWVMNLSDVDVSTESTYPAQFQHKVRGRRKRRMGKHAGLKDLSALVVELPPGVATSLRMWQTNEDEYTYVLSGEVTLITDIGEVVMHAGQSVGFPAGRPIGHHFVNRSQAPVSLLEVSVNSPKGNESIYTEEDLLLVPSADGKQRIFVNRHRQPY